MIKKNTVYFDKGGPQNTKDTFKIIKERLPELKIKTIIVTSTTGKTALTAAEILKDTGSRIICAPFQKHLWKKFTGVDPKIAKKCSELRVKFLPDEPALQLLDDEHPDIVNSFRCFSQGLKVAVQVASMCIDTGLIKNGTEVISIGGTDTGADTAIVLTTHDTKNVLKSKVREIIVIPRV